MNAMKNKASSHTGNEGHIQEMAGNLPKEVRCYQLSGSIKTADQTCMAPDINAILGIHSASLFSTSTGYIMGRCID